MTRSTVTHSMPPHRRFLAWLLTDRVGQGVAMAVSLNSWFWWRLRTRAANWAEAKFSKYPD
ncbi:MAG: hypothetical protein JHC87_03450 [Thermoleophilaceae bacterium]|nr:hypothetical protein [Thermoleophilaceae bacterium]